MVGALAQADRQRIADHQQTVDSLSVARRELETRTRQLEGLRADAERAARAASLAARAHADLVKDVDSRRDLNAQLAGELMAAQQKLQTTLRDLASGVNADVPALPIRPFRGALEWPVSGAVRTRFGRGAGRAPASNGIEIAAAEGTAIQAVHEGLVAYAEPFAGFGSLVIVDHGAQTFSLYGDLLEVTVKRGARIDRGQVVGTAGTAPTGAAGLYFELRVDGRPVDPLEWLRRN
jgi:septal ring factor EnvC (AmiA/AmiB activator)